MLENLIGPKIREQMDMVAGEVIKSFATIVHLLETIVQQNQRLLKLHGDCEDCPDVPVVDAPIDSPTGDLS